MLSKISLGLSALSLIAVGYLLSKSTIDPDTAPPVSTQPIETGQAIHNTDGPRSAVMAYINGDTLNEHYSFIVEKSNHLEAKLKTAEAKVQKEYIKRQSELERLMKYAESNPNMPASEQNAIRADITRMEEEMNQIQERELGALHKQENELQKELQKRVSDYLSTYAKQKGIDYVINNQSALQLVLYGSPAFDITAEVLEGLNAEYAKEKEKENKK